MFKALLAEKWEVRRNRTNAGMSGFVAVVRIFIGHFSNAKSNQMLSHARSEKFA
jgi:hypothetical protein